MWCAQYSNRRRGSDSIHCRRPADHSGSRRFASISCCALPLRDSLLFVIAAGPPQADPPSILLPRFMDGEDSARCATIWFSNPKRHTPGQPLIANGHAPAAFPRASPPTHTHTHTRNPNPAPALALTHPSQPPAPIATHAGRGPPRPTASRSFGVLTRRSSPPPPTPPPSCLGASVPQPGRRGDCLLPINSP